VRKREELRSFTSSIPCIFSSESSYFWKRQMGEISLSQVVKKFYPIRTKEQVEEV